MSTLTLPTILLLLLPTTLALTTTQTANTTTSLLLPNGLFDPSPQPQPFPARSHITGAPPAPETTFYTIDCGNWTTVNFWPGPYGCDVNNSYTFSAARGVTRFLIPDFNLGQTPDVGTSIVPTWLENFNQTVTINCGILDADSTVTCTYTSQFNSEDADDKSIVSPTFVTRTGAPMPESSLYPFIFGGTVAAAATAAPSSAIAPPTASRTSSPATVAGTTATTTTPSASASPNHSTALLTPGAKAGLGIGVSLGAIALAGAALLTYAHGKHSRMRSSQTENLMVPAGRSAEEDSSGEEIKGAPDNGGLYEMQGRRSPAEPGELEG